MTYANPYIDEAVRIIDRNRESYKREGKVTHICGMCGREKVNSEFEACRDCGGDRGNWEFPNWSDL